MRLFPSRAQVPADVWRDALAATTSRIDICVYGGTFLFDTVHGFLRLVRDAATRGVQVRIVVGDPGSVAVHQRGVEEGIGDALAGRCRLTLSRLAPIHELDGVEIRTHSTPLYVSMFFMDDTLYANHHILGSPAGDNPVVEIPRDLDPELWESYTNSFEYIWAGARPRAAPGLLSAKGSIWDASTTTTTPPHRDRIASCRQPPAWCSTTRAVSPSSIGRTTDSGHCPVAGWNSASRSRTARSARSKKRPDLDVEITGLVGVYTNPHHVMKYDDGEVRQQFSLCYTDEVARW